MDKFTKIRSIGSSWISILRSSKNSMLFIMVIACFSLLLYSSIVYFSTTNRVMERQVTNLAISSLVATLSNVYPSTINSYSAGSSNIEIIESLQNPAADHTNPDNFIPFILNSRSEIIGGSDLPDRMETDLVKVLSADPFSRNRFPLGDEYADSYIVQSGRGLFVAVVSPVTESGVRIGLLRDIKYLLSFAGNIERALIGYMVLAYLVFMVLLVIVLRIITKPLVTLTAAAERYAKGDFDFTVAVQTGVTEMIILTDAFNRMGEELKLQHQSLEAYSNKLVEANRKVSSVVEKLSIRNSEQQVMIEASLKANKLATSNDVVRMMMELLRDNLNLEHLVYFLENEDGELIPTAYPWLPDPDMNTIDEKTFNAVKTCLDTLEPQIVPAVQEGAFHLGNLSDKLYIPVSNILGRLGVLELTSDSGKSFDPETQQFCMHFITHMEVIIRNKSLYHETIRRSHELERINQISQAISGKLDMEPLIRDVVEHTQSTIKADCAFVGLIVRSRLEIMHIQPDVPGIESWAVDIDENNIISTIVNSAQELLVSDIHDNEDYIDEINGPFIKANKFNSIIGCPILNKGQVTGVICGFSHKTNAFTSNDAYFLGLLASQVAIALENARLFNEILTRDNRRDHQLKMAQKLQADRIPAFFKQNVAAVSCELQPADELAGDFCDVFSLGRHSIAIVIGDVANKGVAASLMTFSILSMFRNVAKTLKPPCDILDTINRSLIGQVKEEGWFATAFYGKLNTNTGTFTYSSAGHEQPIWYHADSGEVEKLEVEGYPLGLFKCFTYETGEIVLKKGDRIVCYTDGVTDAIGENNKRFGHLRLLGFVADSGHLKAEEFTSTLVRKVEEFTGGLKQKDDIIVSMLEMQEDPWIHMSVKFSESSQLIQDILDGLTPYELSPEETYSIRLAIDEALANAWKHGLDEDDQAQFNVSYLIADEGFRIRVTDPGSGFDHESLPDPTVPENLYKANGRGVFLIRQMMDEVEYNSNGNEISVMKRFVPSDDRGEGTYDDLVLPARLDIVKQRSSLNKAKTAEASDEDEISEAEKAEQAEQDDNIIRPQFD
ncbi:SpoIIE family protein phosphatase [bacterium]|nr:SpoIIE family protein phosphatase [bacterium]